MVDIQSVAAEIRRGKKERQKIKKLQGKNIMATLLHRAAINSNDNNYEIMLDGQKGSMSTYRCPR